MSALPLEVQIKCLHGSPLFQGLTPTECTEIVEIAQECRFARRQTIFRQGDPVTVVLVLLSGRVKIIETARSGTEVILSVDEAGDVIGELGLETGSCHLRTAQALERCRALGWEARTFQTLCERYPALGCNSVRVLEERLGTLEARFRELVTEQVSPRLALTLVRLVKRNVGSAPKKSIGLSHRELARMTGMTASTVSRLLAEWEQRGITRSKGRSVLVEDFAGLLTLVDKHHRRVRKGPGST